MSEYLHCEICDSLKGHELMSRDFIRNETMDLG